MRLTGGPHDLFGVFVATNHNHNFGPVHQHSFVKWEGLSGAARITMGLNLDYPAGKPGNYGRSPVLR